MIQHKFWTRPRNLQNRRTRLEWSDVKGLPMNVMKRLRFVPAALLLCTLIPGLPGGVMGQEREDRGKRRFPTKRVGVFVLALAVGVIFVSARKFIAGHRAMA